MPSGTIFSRFFKILPSKYSNFLSFQKEVDYITAIPNNPFFSFSHKNIILSKHLTKKHSRGDRNDLDVSSKVPHNVLFSIEAQDIKIQNLRSSREKCSHLVPSSEDKTGQKTSPRHGPRP